MKKNSKSLLIILIVAILLEVFVFNITSFRLLFGNYERQEYSVSLNEINDDKAYLEAKDINRKVGTIKVIFSEDAETMDYRLFYIDETSSRYFTLPGKVYVSGEERTAYIPVYLSGNVKNLSVEIDEIHNELNMVEKIVVNENIPIDFNVVRLLIIMLVIFFIIAFKKSKIFNSEYDKKNLKQEFLLIGVLAVALIIAAWINVNAINNVEGERYSKEFVLAVANNQFHLLEEPSELFKSLEDPYDAITRTKETKREVDYKWDTAYYNGHQYIYFGILPLILTFLPYYLVTRKFLDISIVIFIFTAIIFVTLKEILIKVLRRYFEHLSFKSVFCSLVIFLSGTLIWYGNGMGRIYELAILSGLAFVLMGINFILTSMDRDTRKYRFIFAGSLCLALSVACRPTDLLASLLIVPYLLKLLIDNIKNFKNDKISLFKLILVVGIPYIVVGSLLMMYNYVRFDNPFDFGAKYQLTVNNMLKLGNRFSSIPFTLMINLFSVPIFEGQFPFITHHNNIMVYYGYHYIENMIGGLFIIAPICFANFFVFKAFRKSKNKELKILISELLIVGVISAGLSAMMAGSNQRYLIDYAWMFILAGILIFMILLEKLKSVEAKRILEKMFGIITVFTFFVGIGCGIIGEHDYFEYFSKEEYYKTRYTICFWE